MKTPLMREGSPQTEPGWGWKLYYVTFSEFMF